MRRYFRPLVTHVGRAKVGISGGWGRLQVVATDLKVFYASPSSRGQCFIYGAFNVVEDWRGDGKPA